MTETQKQYLTRIVRWLGLLPLAERLRAEVMAWKNHRANRRFCASHHEDPLPPISLMHDPYGVVDYAGYWNSGKSSARALGEIINASHGGGDRTIKILEWGCGPARVIRHLSAAQSDRRYDLSGTDYNKKMISWCQSSLPEINFSTNELAPPLGYPDSAFDFIYCLSVFTHLSEAMHHGWIKELLRVLKPGGCILLSLHGDFFRRKMLPDELKQYDAGDLVVRTGFIEGGRMYTAFHGERFVREKLLGRCEILRHDTSDNQIAPPQDVWLMRKTTAE
jgi:SAM-dependent methyltransferase